MPPDWNRVTDDTVEHLRQLIRFRTINPPGNEHVVAEYLSASLSKAGIETEVIETAPERAAVVGRIRGAGPKLPLLLVAHTDVVGADVEHWSVDPFAGVLRDGYVYGRGAIDDKGMLAVNLVTSLLLQSEIVAGNLRLTRDVIFLATPDEESGGAAGMQWLLEHRRDVLDAEYALNEGGRIRVAPDRSRTLLIQTGEKSSHVLAIVARGVAGHTAVPRADNAILRLGRALASISEYAADPSHGVSPTLLTAGSKSNVIPDAASATLDVRTTAEQSLEVVVATLTRLINDPDIAVVVAVRGHDAPSSPASSAMFSALEDAARTLDPGIDVRSYVSAGVTDSAALRRLGIKAYGVLPFPLDADDESRMHGVDERVPVAALAFGTRLVFETVCRIAGQEPLNS